MATEKERANTYGGHFFGASLLGEPRGLGSFMC